MPIPEDRLIPYLVVPNGFQDAPVSDGQYEVCQVAQVNPHVAGAYELQHSLSSRSPRTQADNTRR